MIKYFDNSSVTWWFSGERSFPSVLLLTAADAVSCNNINKTSSPRATIAHLRVNKYSHWTKGSYTAAVQGRIWLKFELIQDVMVILVSSKNEEDPIKIEGARVATIHNIDFSNTKGQ